MKRFVIPSLVLAIASVLYFAGQGFVQPPPTPAPGQPTPSTPAPLVQPAYNQKEVEDALVSLKNALDEYDREAKQRDLTRKDEDRKAAEARRRFLIDSEAAFKTFLKAQQDAQEATATHATTTAGAGLLTRPLASNNPHEQAKSTTEAGQQPAGGKATGPVKADDSIKAICVVTPFGDSKVAGTLHFVQKGTTVDITGEITGLSPGKHGFHVHEFGDISGKDGMTTGGHFNPDKMPHGPESAEKRHVGDLGNITADKDGKAVINMKDTIIRLNGGHSIVGRAVIVHAKEDDFSQPVGNAGARVGGGVIGVAK